MMNAECRILTSTFCILHSIKDVRLPSGAVRRRRKPEMPVRRCGGGAAARGARQESLLHQERLLALLERSPIFADGGGDRRESHRAPVELLDDRLQDAGIHVVESELIDVESFEGFRRDGCRDRSAGAHLGVVPHPLQQAVGDTRGAATAAGDFGDAGGGGRGGPGGRGGGGGPGGGGGGGGRGAPPPPR